MRDLIVGIDIGTTSVKALVITAVGEITYERSISHDLYSPRAGYAEEDAGVWWESIKMLLADISTSLDKKRIAAVGISGMVPTLILVDEKGEPLYRSIQQNDARASVEIEEFRDEIDEAGYFSLTANSVNQQVIFPKYRWLWKHYPDLVERTRFIMGSYNYCTYCLTGVASLELNWALESGMWLIKEKMWHEEILRKANIKKELLPPVFSSTDTVGKTTTRVESETGFPAGIPVTAGCADHVASALATGVKDNGDVLVKLGGAGDILFATDHLRLDRRLFIDYHSLKDRYLLNGCMASSGSIVKWFSREFNLPDLSELDQCAEKIEPGSEGLILLPYFIGEKTPIFDVHARGVCFGLSLFHSKYHIFRAILEAVAYGFLHHIEVIKEMGFTVRNLYLSNGGAKSDLWKRIVVDAVGQPGIYIPNHPGSSLGVALLAAHAVGESRDWKALKDFLRRGIVIPFTEENHRKYQRYFEIYLRLYDNLKPLFMELANIRGKTESPSNG